MKKLMTTAAVLVALIAPASALTIPTQFRGDWCSINDHSDLYSRGRCSEIDSLGVLKVRVTSFGMYEIGCKAVAVVSNSKGAWRARFQCFSEGETFKSVTEFKLVGKRLSIRTISTNVKQDADE